MRRIALFLATNLAVLVLFGVALTALGALGVLPPELLEARGFMLGVAAVFGFGGAFVSLLLSKSIAKWSTRATVIERPSNRMERWLVDTVGELAERRGIGMPEVAVYASPDPNAFATGWHRDRSLVAVSTGLLQALDVREARAVLAHEVSHVASGDMVTLALIQGVLNTFVILAARVIGSVVDRLVFHSERGYGPGFWITTMLAQILLGVLATLVVMAFSRWRELRADAGAADLVGAPPMIDALRGLQSAAGESTLPEALRAFGIHGRGIAGLLASHPPIAVRIERLAAHQAREQSPPRPARA